MNNKNKQIPLGFVQIKMFLSNPQLRMTPLLLSRMSVSCSSGVKSPTGTERKKNFPVKTKQFALLDENHKNTFYNQCFDKGRLKNFVLWFLLNYGENQTVQLVEQLKNIGFLYASKAGISLGIDDLKIPPKKYSLIYEAEKQTKLTVNQYVRGEITGIERFQRLIDTWHRTSEILKQEVIKNFESTDLLNPVYMMAFSGARGNISQVRQLVGMRGLMADPQGQILDFPIRSNFREGLTLTEYIISSYGARKGIVDTALRTANAGYLTRRLVDVAQHVIISNFDCGTRRGIFLIDMKEGNKTIHSLTQRAVGRILARDLYISPAEHSSGSSGGESPNSQSVAHGLHKIASRNEEITLDLAYEIGKKFTKVFVRSPLTCETNKLICQLCYGWSLAQGNLVSIGEAVGVVAAQSIGEPGTQLTMRTFHTGGVFSGDISDQIRAPFDGIIEYLSAIPGTLIRTPEGKIAFLTKGEGSFLVSKKDAFVQNSGPQGEAPEVGRQKEISKKFKIPTYTLLYIRNGQMVSEKEVIAQISNISQKTNATDYAELTIKSEYEGLFYSKSLSFREKEVGPPSVNKDLKKEKLTPSGTKHPSGNGKDGQSHTEKIYEAWTWGYAWILSGKIYEFKFPPKEPFFTKIGDVLNYKSAMNQTLWKLSLNTGLRGHKVFFNRENIQNQKAPSEETPCTITQPILSLDLNRILYKKNGYFLTRAKKTAFLAFNISQNKHPLFGGVNVNGAKGNGTVNHNPWTDSSRSDLLFFMKSLKNPFFPEYHFNGYAPSVQSQSPRKHMVQGENLQQRGSFAEKSPFGKNKYKTDIPYLLQWFPAKYQTSTGGYAFYETFMRSCFAQNSTLGDTHLTAGGLKNTQYNTDVFTGSTLGHTTNLSTYKNKYDVDHFILNKESSNSSDVWGKTPPLDVCFKKVSISAAWKQNVMKQQASFAIDYTLPSVGAIQPPNVSSGAVHSGPQDGMLSLHASSGTPASQENINPLGNVGGSQKRNLEGSGTFRPGATHGKQLQSKLTGQMGYMSPLRESNNLDSLKFKSPFLQSFFFGMRWKNSFQLWANFEEQYTLKNNTQKSGTPFKPEVEVASNFFGGGSHVSLGASVSRKNAMNGNTIYWVPSEFLQVQWADTGSASQDAQTGGQISTGTWRYRDWEPGLQGVGRNVHQSQNSQYSQSFYPGARLIKNIPNTPFMIQTNRQGYYKPFFSVMEKTQNIIYVSFASRDKSACLGAAGQGAYPEGKSILSASLIKKQEGLAKNYALSSLETQLGRGNRKNLLYSKPDLFKKHKKDNSLWGYPNLWPEARDGRILKTFAKDPVKGDWGGAEKLASQQGENYAPFGKNIIGAGYSQPGEKPSFSYEEIRKLQKIIMKNAAKQGRAQGCFAKNRILFKDSSASPKDNRSKYKGAFKFIGNHKGVPLPSREFYRKKFMLNFLNSHVLSSHAKPEESSFGNDGDNSRSLLLSNIKKTTRPSFKRSFTRNIDLGQSTGHPFLFDNLTSFCKVIFCLFKKQIPAGQGPGGLMSNQNKSFRIEFTMDSNKERFTSVPTRATKKTLLRNFEKLCLVSNYKKEEFNKTSKIKNKEKLALFMADGKNFKNSRSFGKNTIFGQTVKQVFINPSLKTLSYDYMSVFGVSASNKRNSLTEWNQKNGWVYFTNKHANVQSLLKLHKKVVFPGQFFLNNVCFDAPVSLFIQCILVTPSSFSTMEKDFRTESLPSVNKFVNFGTSQVPPASQGGHPFGLFGMCKAQNLTWIKNQKSRFYPALQEAVKGASQTAHVENKQDSNTLPRLCLFIQPVFQYQQMNSSDLKKYIYDSTSTTLPRRGLGLLWRPSNNIKREGLQNSIERYKVSLDASQAIGRNKEKYSNPQLHHVLVNKSFHSFFLWKQNQTKIHNKQEKTSSPLAPYPNSDFYVLLNSKQSFYSRAQAESTHNSSVSRTKKENLGGNFITPVKQPASREGARTPLQAVRKRLNLSPFIVYFTTPFSQRNNYPFKHHTYSLNVHPVLKGQKIFNPLFSSNLLSLLSSYLNLTQSYSHPSSVWSSVQSPASQKNSLYYKKNKMLLFLEYNHFNTLIPKLYQNPCFAFSLVFRFNTSFLMPKKSTNSSEEGAFGSKGSNIRYLQKNNNFSTNTNRKVYSLNRRSPFTKFSYEFNQEIYSGYTLAKTIDLSPFTGEVVYQHFINTINTPVTPANFSQEGSIGETSFEMQSARLGVGDAGLISGRSFAGKNSSCMILTKRDFISYYLQPQGASQRDSDLKENLKQRKKEYKINDIFVQQFLNTTDSRSSFDLKGVGGSDNHLNSEPMNLDSQIKISKLAAGTPYTGGLCVDGAVSSSSSLLGDFLVFGDQIYSGEAGPEGASTKTAIPTSGQIVHYNNHKITLRRAQPIFISPKGILHKFDGDFIDPKAPVITLSYQRLKTGDIIQGIPKVEQFFEARTTKRGRLFRDSLPSLLKGLFKRYQAKYPLFLAVRQSFYKIQQILVDGVQRVYKSQGVTIADKHLEVIVKQMTSKVRILDGAQTGFFPGEVVDLIFVEKINNYLIKKITYEPLVLGITKASLEVDSFLSAASFQQTTRVLSKAAIYRKKDFLKGLKENVILGNLIPAGTGFLVYLDDFASPESKD